jgi:metallophosphoesterase superfamily enzyme
VLTINLCLGIASRIDTALISGNHDPATRCDFGGTSAYCVMIGNIMLCHIPGKIEDGTHEIVGHLHHGAHIINQGRSVHGKCFVADQHRMIMPAFGTTKKASTSPPKSSMVQRNAGPHMDDRPGELVWVYIEKSAVGVSISSDS